MRQFDRHFPHCRKPFDTLVLLLESFDFGNVPDDMESPDWIAG